MFGIIRFREIIIMMSDHSKSGTQQKSRPQRLFLRIAEKLEAAGRGILLSMKTDNNSFGRYRRTCPELVYRIPSLYTRVQLH
jgi:hypothetical protein